MKIIRIKLMIWKIKFNKKEIILKKINQKQLKIMKIKCKKLKKNQI